MNWQHLKSYFFQFEFPAINGQKQTLIMNVITIEMNATARDTCDSEGEYDIFQASAAACEMEEEHDAPVSRSCAKIPMSSSVSELNSAEAPDVIDVTSRAIAICNTNGSEADEDVSEGSVVADQEEQGRDDYVATAPIAAASELNYPIVADGDLKPPSLPSVTPAPSSKKAKPNIQGIDGREEDESQLEQGETTKDSDSDNNIISVHSRFSSCQQVDEIPSSLPTKTVNPFTNKQVEEEEFRTCLFCSHDMNSTSEDCCANCSEKRDELDEDEMFLWSCSECDHLNEETKSKCGNCKISRDRKRPVKSSKDGKGHKKMKLEIEEGNSEVEPDVTPFLCLVQNNAIENPWTCIKCKEYNTTSNTKCHKCRGWKDGKRPVKKRNTPSKPRVDVTKKGKANRSPPPHTAFLKKGPKPKVKVNGPKVEAVKKGDAKKPSPPHAALLKKDRKPQFKVHDKVFAPWWPESKSKSKQTWCSGVITEYSLVKYGEYGEIRKYSIRFDVDKSVIHGIEDYCVFSREDYLLHGKKWLGVENSLDVQSRDKWARVVGWYEATIGECDLFVFLAKFRSCSSLLI